MAKSGLRLLLIGDYPLKEEFIIGGVQAVTRTLAQALARHEAVHQVTVLSFHQGRIAHPFTKVHSTLQIIYVRRQRALTIATRSVLDVWQARRVAAAIDPHLVHGQGIGRSGYIATQLAVPSVVTVHGLVHREARLAGAQTLTTQLRTSLLDRMVQHVFKHAHLIISSSHYDAHSLAGLIRGPHTIIPNPIDPMFFTQPGQSPPTNQVLFAGLLHHRKNLEGVLRAFARVLHQVPAARLLIVGPEYDPQYTDTLRQQVQALQLTDQVQFVGHVSTSDLVQVMRACQVLALFSHEETLPTAIAQALALGKPVVASRVGGVPELIVDGENGFLVEPGDEAGFAERLVTLLTHPAIARTLGERGQQLAHSSFAPSVIAQRTLDAYQVILSRCTRRPA
jgi:glycosyltransferase involved in cell wall biosynthesis